MKPCWHCEEKEDIEIFEFLADEDLDRDQFFVQCEMCGASGPVCYTEEEAIAAWNSRPIEDKLRQEVDELNLEVNRLYEENEKYKKESLKDFLPVDTDTVISVLNEVRKK